MKRSTLIAAGLLVAVGSSIWFGSRKSPAIEAVEVVHGWTDGSNDVDVVRSVAITNDSSAKYGHFITSQLIRETEDGTWYQPLPGFKLVAVPDRMGSLGVPNATSSPTGKRETP